MAKKENKFKKKCYICGTKFYYYNSDIKIDFSDGKEKVECPACGHIFRHHQSWFKKLFHK